MAQSKTSSSVKRTTKKASKSKKKSKVNSKRVKTAKSSKGSKGFSTKKLNQKELKYFKEKLLKEKQRVLEEMGDLQNNNLMQSIADQSGEISRYSYHLGDTASLSYGREFSMGLAERQQKYLEQVEEALERIENATYGICKVTGEPIPIERLEEVPVAKYSVKGKEILEKKKNL